MVGEVGMKACGLELSRLPEGTRKVRNLRLSRLVGWWYLVKISGGSLAKISAGVRNCDIVGGF
jgi:hypothetical protein